jgi:general secretion pathway protein J
VFTENQPSRLQVVSYRLRDGVLSGASRRHPRPAAARRVWQAALSDTDPTPAVALQDRA